MFFIFEKDENSIIFIAWFVKTPINGVSLAYNELIPGLHEPRDDAREPLQQEGLGMPGGPVFNTETPCFHQWLGELQLALRDSQGDKMYLKKI